MGLFTFIGDIVDDVGTFLGIGGADLSGALISAGIETVGSNLFSGASGSTATTTQVPIQKTKSAGVATSRVPRPSTPDAPAIDSVTRNHAEWMNRLARYAQLSAATDPGGPRILGTQQRRT